MRYVRELTAAGRRMQCRAYHLWDGFDNYDSSHELWPVINGTPDYSSAYARFAAPSGTLGQGCRFLSGIGPYKQWNMISNQSTMIFGFAFFTPRLSTGEFMYFMDAGTVQCSLHFTPTGGILLQASFNGTTLAATGPGVIAPNTWYWIDIQITISATGSIQIYINQPAGGAATLTASGINTKQTGNAYMNAFRVGDISNSFTGLLIDDFHAHDTTGSAPNAILGDSRIFTKKANAAGYTTNWTPNGASANWQCSDDSPPDGDTTYNSSNTPGAIDGYAVPGAGFTVAPNGVVRRSYVRRDDAGPHTFQNGIRSGSTNALGTAFTVPSSYAWTDGNTCYVNDPATSVPWATAAAADAAAMIIDETS